MPFDYPFAFLSKQTILALATLSDEKTRRAFTAQHNLGGISTERVTHNHKTTKPNENQFSKPVNSSKKVADQFQALHSLPQLIQY